MVETLLRSSPGLHALLLTGAGVFTARASSSGKYKHCMQQCKQGCGAFRQKGLKDAEEGVRAQARRGGKSATAKETTRGQLLEAEHPKEHDITGCVVNNSAEV